MSTPTEYLDTTDVARIYRVGRATVERWARDGRLPAIRVGKKWLFTPDQLVFEGE